MRRRSWLGKYFLNAVFKGSTTLRVTGRIPPWRINESRGQCSEGIHTSKFRLYTCMLAACTHTHGSLVLWLGALIKRCFIFIFKYKLIRCREQDAKSHFTPSLRGRATAKDGCRKWECNNTLLLYLLPAETPFSCLLSSLDFISSIICYCLSKNRKTT